MISVSFNGFMITLEKLYEFERYGGDGDLWSRAKAKGSSPINDAEWHLVDTLIQDVIVIDRKLGSEERTKQALERLRSNCESDAVIEGIRRLIRRKI